MPRRPIQVLAWTLAAVLVGAGAGLVTTSWSSTTRQSPPSLFDLALPDSLMPSTPYDPWDASIALSPDGSVVAYVGGSTQSLFVRPLDERLPRRLEGTEGSEPCLSFSPDGQWLAFISHFRLRKIAIRGGSPFTIADSAASCQAWTDRNELAFNWRGSLYRVSADGGRVSLVTREGDVLPTHALPGGNASLACLGRGFLGVVSLTTGQITELSEGRVEGCPARYADGHVVFARNRTMFAAPFSLRRLRVSGPEVPLLRDSLATFTTGSATLAYISASAPRSFTLVAVSEDGKTRTLGGLGAERVAGSRPLLDGRRAPMPLDTAYYAWPRLSPDGKRVAMELYGNYGEVIWVYTIASRTLSRLNTRSRGIQPTGWTPDSRNVIYIEIDSGNVGGPRRVVAQPWDGSAPARELVRFPERFSGSIQTLFDVSIGPAHGHVAFVVGNFSDTADIWIAPLDTPSRARPLLVTRSREYQPRLSPDGNFVAYTTNETGREEVNIRSVVGPATVLQVSTGGGSQPQWSRDGRGLFYRAPSYRTPGFMLRATLARGVEPTVVRRDTLFRDVFNTFDIANYDVFPGDKELLMILPNRQPVHTSIALNWRELLRQGAAPR